MRSRSPKALSSLVWYNPTLAGRGVLEEGTMERRDNPLITGITTATVAGLSAAVLLVIVGGALLLCVLLTAACILVAGSSTGP